MEIFIETSKIQFKNPEVGKPTRAVEEHYYGRRITALVNNEKKYFRFKKEELAFEVDEDDMIQAIEQRLSEEN
ncbi:hypothetical protein DCC39_10270 [Pueribacillus theae]|uniref:Uncharacterized protein n=1 Tax=Pueribacillus theae TaxID=2171751 RepID=A0A2U1K1K9_9BACI|nr:hypothetical protein [Pueribacillus theae]PWA11074.1 hypothetical protein DCC39_10270 [Pueribacillus theae]